jgi:hypothetical protein
MTEQRKPLLAEEEPNVMPPVATTSKWITKLAFLGLAVIALTMGVFAYWAAETGDPLTITNAPFPVRTIRQEPTPDGVLILTVDYCKNSNVPGKVRTSFVSATREVFLPVGEEHLPKGCHKNVEVPVIIPKDLLPDTYKIKFRTTYNINPLKSEVVKEFESRSFTVAGPGEPGTTMIAPQP